MYNRHRSPLSSRVLNGHPSGPSHLSFQTGIAARAPDASVFRPAPVQLPLSVAWPVLARARFESSALPATVLEQQCSLSGGTDSLADSSVGDTEDSQASESTLLVLLLLCLLIACRASTGNPPSHLATVGILAGRFTSPLRHGPLGLPGAAATRRTAGPVRRNGPLKGDGGTSGVRKEPCQGTPGPQGGPQGGPFRIVPLQ